MFLRVQNPERIGEFRRLLGSDQSPHSLKENLGAWRMHNHEEFEDLAFDWLKVEADSSASQLLASMIVVTQGRVRQLCDSVFYSAAEAMSIVRHLARSHGQLAYSLVDIGLAANVDNGTAERVLCLVEAAASKEQMCELMSPFLDNSNSRVRAKAVLLGTKSSMNPRWAGPLLLDPDPRIAANVVEGLWDADDRQDILAFFQEAAKEDNPRTVANALVGLIRFGDSAAIKTLEDMTKGESADFRASAAWAMGETAFPVFLPCLQVLVGDPEPKVKLNAVRSLRRIHLSLERS